MPANLKTLLVGGLLLSIASTASAASKSIAETLVIGGAMGLMLGVVQVVIVFLKRRKNTKLANTLPELVLSAAEGNISAVTALLDSGVDPNVTGPGAQTALMMAARNGHSETVRVLLARGADPARRLKTGGTAEEIATTYKQIECAEIISAARRP